MSNPYLSIVLAARNDNYGGDFTERLQLCLDYNIALLEKNKINAELIIVNWNPVAENKSLQKLIVFPAERKFVKCRIITVSSEIHIQYVNPEIRKTVPLFEFIAKNTGIRRAQGEYILCINADIFIHPAIIEFIASGKLSDEYYYRADRLDFSPFSEIPSETNFYNNAEIAFMKGFAYRFNSVFGKQLQYRILKIFNPLRIEWELWKFRNASFCNKLGINVVYDNAAYCAHCHNAGDFMLMHKTHWLGLKGYPENTFISTHTDALFTVLASSLLNEHVFPVPVFHRQHERRYSWNAIKHESVFLEAFKNFESVAKKIFSGENKAAFLNDDNWGLKIFNIEEIQA